MFNDGDLTVVEADGHSPKADQALKAKLSICLVSLESFIHLVNEYLLNLTCSSLGQVLEENSEKSPSCPVGVTEVSSPLP